MTENNGSAFKCKTYNTLLLAASLSEEPTLITIDRVGPGHLMNATKNSIFSQILIVTDEFEYMQSVGSAAVFADMCVLSSRLPIYTLVSRCCSLDSFASVELK